jgi:hypothetical protein
MMRSDNTVDGAGANSAFNVFLLDIAPAAYTIAPLAIEHSIQGSNVRNTVPMSLAPSYGTGINTTDDRRARTVSFVGRSNLGHRARLTVFGIKDISEPDYRVDTTESTVVSSVVTLLNGAVGVFLAIDGQKAVWKSYGNINFNDHWIKVFRKAGG